MTDMRSEPTCGACGGDPSRASGPSEHETCEVCGGAIRYKPDGDVIPWRSDWVIKLDPETDHKPPMELLDLDFAAAMADVFGAGVKDGRAAGDWRGHPQTDETRDKYRAKILRHLREYTNGNGREHLAAIACDACILWTMEGE